MACECSTWYHYFGTGIMLYKSTCRLYGHAERAVEQIALSEAIDDLICLRRKWRNKNCQLPRAKSNGACI